MYRILVVERSATLRHGLCRLFREHDYEITLAHTFEEGLDRLHNTPTEFEGIIIGWPSRTDDQADEMLAFLESPSYQDLAVLILSEEPDPAKLNWTTRRPSTAMLLWADYHEAVESLTKLLDSPRLDRCESVDAYSGPS